MSRRRRRLISNSCYEFCFRAKRSLPFTAHRIIREIIGSSLARAQRDDKLILCHDIWNGSHAHIVAVTKDADQAKNFFAELEKKITDSLKRLLGLDYLNLWEGRPMMARIMDLDAAKKRIVYLYSNPAQDDRAESIDQFAGYSTWRGFMGSRAKANAQTVEKFPWISLPSIPSVSSRNLSPAEDDRLVRLVRYHNKKRIHRLTRYPNAWMKCFGISTDQEAAEINDSIIDRIGENERAESARRKAEGKTVPGTASLLSEPLMKDHIPKKRERKIFVIASKAETRIAEIESFDRFSLECVECFQAWRVGDFSVEWPPGAFRPPLSPCYNVLPSSFG